MKLPLVAHNTIAVLMSLTLAFSPALAYAETADDQLGDEAVVQDDQDAVDDEADDVQGSDDEGDVQEEAGEDDAQGDEQDVPVAGEDDSSDQDATPADDSDDVADDQQVGDDQQASDSEEATDEPVDETPAEEVPAEEEPTDGDDAEATGKQKTEKPKKAAVPLPTYFGTELVGKNALANGIYEISSGIDQTYTMQVQDASQVDGALLTIGTRSNTIHQRWRITYDSTKKNYTITNINSGKLLETRDGKPMHKGDVQQDTANGHAAQRWRIFKAQDGNVYIISAIKLSGGKVAILTVLNGRVSNGRQVMTWNPTTNGGPAQQWKLTPITRTVNDGIYYVNSALNSKYRLAVDGGKTANNTNALLTTASRLPSQWWRIKYDSKTGYYKVISCVAEKALEVAGGKNANGTNIDIYDKAGDQTAQRWSVSPNAQGGYTLVSATGGKVLTVAGNKATKGANVELRANGGNAGQSWNLSIIKHPQVAEGSYRMLARTNLLIAVGVADASKAANANVALTNRGGSNAQIWHVGEADASGWRPITAAHSGAYLSVDKEGNVCMSNSAKVTNYQRWKIVPESNGYRLVNKAFSDKVLTFASSTAKKGVNVSVAEDTGSAMQRVEIFTATPTIKVSEGEPIMGTSQITQIQAVRYFKSTGKQLPDKWVKDGVTIEDLVKYFWAEGAAEGVRGDVAFAQSLLETGMFQFGNLVQPSQYNFAGLGATGPGHPGCVYKNARIGIRAQIQHLKAYASTKPLNQTLVDERYDLVEHGCAPTIKGLSGKWAVPGYSYENGKIVYYHDSILAYMKAMLSI